MIIDKIENQNIYKSLSSGIEKGFDFINKNDLIEMPLGKYEIEGEDIFAIVMEYETKEKSECKFEGHHKYIDLQYIISGTEYVSLKTLTDQTPVESSTEKDYDFYNIDSEMLKFEPGRFMIFFPDDLHQPGIQLDKVSIIKKVVVKIKA